MSCKILVTGVSGFVGGALGAYLRRLGGYNVLGISRRTARYFSTDRFVSHDLRKPLPADLGKHDAIVHCAALSSPWASPAAFRAHNVQATQNVIEHARRTGCPRLVFISSSSVFYRAGDQFGITEETPFPDPPINEYAATKREAERLVLECGVPSIVLRPRAVFGPEDTVLFPRILRAARFGLLPRLVRPDGLSPRCDLIYIGNLSHYIERAIWSGERGCFNLTNNEAVDLYGFLGKILERLGLPRIRRTMRVDLAYRLASHMERISRLLFAYAEPPLTRFGVEALAYSKTFDVAKAVRTFGEPPIPLREGMHQFIEWQIGEWNAPSSS